MRTSNSSIYFKIGFSWYFQNGKVFCLDTLAYFTRTFKDFRFSLRKENRRDGKIFVQTYREQWEIHYVKLFITAEMMQIEITPIYRRVIKQIVPIKTWLPIWTLRITISFMWEPKSFIHSFFLHNHVQANLYISSPSHCIFLLVLSFFDANLSLTILVHK